MRGRREIGRTNFVSLNWEGLELQVRLKTAGASICGP